MSDFIKAISESAVEHSFYRAVLATHKNAFEEARQYIDQTRSAIDKELGVLLQVYPSKYFFHSVV
jgi:hypothetical protein